MIYTCICTCDFTTHHLFSQWAAGPHQIRTECYPLRYLHRSELEWGLPGQLYLLASVTQANFYSFCLNPVIDYDKQSGLPNMTPIVFTKLYSLLITHQHMLFSVQVLMCKGKVWFITDQWLGLYSCYLTIPVMQSHVVCAWATLIKCVMTRWLSAILKCEYTSLLFLSFVFMSSSATFHISPSSLVSCSNHNVFSL